MGAPAKVDPNTPGGRIRMLRRAFGWSQMILATKANVSQPAISLWEQNLTEPGDASLRALASALNTTPHFLYPERWMAAAS